MLPSPLGIFDIVSGISHSSFLRIQFLHNRSSSHYQTGQRRLWEGVVRSLDSYTLIMCETLTHVGVYNLFQQTPNSDGHLLGISKQDNNVFGNPFTRGCLLPLDEAHSSSLRPSSQSIQSGSRTHSLSTISISLSIGSS